MKVTVISYYSDGKTVCQIELSGEEQAEIVRVQGSDAHDRIGRNMTIGLCNAVEIYRRQQEALDAVKEHTLNILA